MRADFLSSTGTYHYRSRHCDVGCYVRNTPNISNILQICTSSIQHLEQSLSKIRFSVSHTRFSLLLNLLMSVTWSLFSFLVALVRHFLVALITIARPPSSSSLKITDRSFRYASPCSLWNNLPALFRQPRSSSVTTITLSITSSLFHPRLKTHLFNKSFYLFPTINSVLPTGLPTGLQPDCLHGFYTAQRLVLVFSLFSFCWRVCRIKLAFSQFLITL